MNPLAFGYVDSIIEKISYPPVKSDTAPTNVRTSPLINAIVYNNFQLAKFLLELGVDVNYPDEEKRTPLMHAVRQVGAHTGSRNTGHPFSFKPNQPTSYLVFIRYLPQIVAK
jgi:ankyrin repeat protein